MKSSELRDKTAADLKELQASLARQLFTARFRNFTNQLDDTSSLAKMRCDIARVKTMLRLQELNQTAVAAAPSEAK